MRNLTRRLCLIFLIFSMSFSAAQDSASESKHLLGKDGHGLPPKNLHEDNEVNDDSLPVANQKDDDKPPEESINSEDEVKPDSTENLPDTDLLVKSEQSDSNDDSPTEDAKFDGDVIPLSSEDDEEKSSEDDEEKISEDVKATDNSNPDELSTVPGEEENIRHENSDDNRQNESPPQDEINEQNLGEKDIIGKTDAADSDKHESDDNQNPEDEESKHDEDPKNLDNSEASDDEKVSEYEKESKDDKESEDNADLEDKSESEDTTESDIVNSSENLENQYDELENVFEAEYDPNEELSENQYDESQDDFEEEKDEKHDEEVAEQTSEDSEILTDRFGREMGRESSPTQKFFGLVAIIVMASMLVYFLKFQSPRLEKDETRYQPLNDVDDSPEHVRMSLINGATDDADDDDEEDEVWKWS